MKERYSKVIVTIIAMVLLLMPLQSFAEDVSLYDEQLYIMDNSDNGSWDGAKYTAKAPYKFLGTNTNTINMYNDGESEAIIEFKYSFSNCGSYTINGVEPNSSGDYSIVVESGDSVDIAISSSWTSDGTVTLTNIKYSLLEPSSNIAYDFDDSLGTVSVNGVGVGSGNEVTIESPSAEVVATPLNGAKFIAWVDEDDKIISENSTYTQYSVGDITVKALFSKDTPYFIVDNTYILSDLNQAAEKGNTIVLKCDGTLGAGTYTIPTGKTLLIPFDDAHTMYTDSPKPISDRVLIGKESYQEPVAYRTLTMQEGANITVNGAINLSAKHFAGDTHGGVGGAPTGKVSFIKMNKNSSITVNNGGKLYAWGYITGEGNVIAKSGAEVFEYFQFTDFRGGSQTTLMAGGNQTSNRVFPLSQYYVQNIEAPLTIEAGASETTYTSILVSYMINGSGVSFFGDGVNKKGMFNLTYGYVTKRYDGAHDRLIVDLYGTMSVDPLDVGIGGINMNSKSYELPINSNITINVKAGSEITINQNINLLPGAEIRIDEGAVGKLNKDISAYVYDAQEWGKYCYSQGNVKFSPIIYAPGKSYTRTEKDLVDGAVILNGTFDASGAYVYTTQSGANIYSEGTGRIIMQSGLANATTKQVIQNGSEAEKSEYVNIPITTAKLKNSDGTYVEYDGKHTEFTYADGVWNPTHTFENYICECGEEKRVTNTNYSIADGDITITSKLIMEIPSTSIIIVATYDSTDKLLNSKSFLKDELDSVTFSNKDVNKIKVFSWGGFNTIEPIALVEEKSVQQ